MKCQHPTEHMTVEGPTEVWYCNTCGVKVFDDSDTLGGKLRIIEFEARKLGAWDTIAKVDQVRARQREETEKAIRAHFTS